MPKHVSCGYLFGDPLLIPVPDLDRTDHLLILGANPYESNGSLCTAPDFPGRIEAIRARGGTVVVVDPRRTKTAEHADDWLAIVPGTDAHLLMAMIHVLVTESLIDLGALADHVSGLDELARASRAFTPEVVGPVCGIDAERIRALTRHLAHAESAAVYGRIGTHAVAFGTIAAWAVDVVNVLTGNLDRPGGAMFPLPAHQSGVGKGSGRGVRDRAVTPAACKGYPEVRRRVPRGHAGRRDPDAGRRSGASARDRGRQPGAVRPGSRPARRRPRTRSTSW